MNFILKITIILVTMISGPTKASELLNVKCGPLRGTKLTIVNGQTITQPESQIEPILLVDSDYPKKLISIWKPKLFGKDITEKFEATVIELSSDKVQAIEQDSNGLYSYTIFRENGTLFYTHHRLRSPFDEVPSLLSFVATCEIKTWR